MCRHSAGPKHCDRATPDAGCCTQKFFQAHVVGPASYGKKPVFGKKIPKKNISAELCGPPSAKDPGPEKTAERKPVATLTTSSPA